MRLLAIMVLMGVQTVSAAEKDVEARLLDCADIERSSARLECFDALVRERRADAQAAAGVMTSERAVEPPADSTPHTPAPAAESADDFGRESLPQPSGQESAQIQAIESELVRVEERPYGHRVFYLENGQVWTEVQPERVRYRAGDLVRIERAALGSFMLSVEGRRASRVRRLE